MNFGDFHYFFTHFPIALICLIGILELLRLFIKSITSFISLIILLISTIISFLSVKSGQIEKSKITAESGVMLGKLVKESMKRNLTGLESLIGVPGTLGGALVMNAGAFGGEISNYLIIELEISF